MGWGWQEIRLGTSRVLDILVLKCCEVFNNRRFQGGDYVFGSRTQKKDLG